jgi:hypothetical protein
MQDGRQENKAVFAAGQFLGQADDPRQDARRLDDGGVGTAPEGVLAFEFDGKVQALVEHFREGVRRVEPDRRQHRHHFAQEIIADPLALRLVPRHPAQETDALVGQRRQDDVVEVLVLFGDDGVGFGRNQTEGLLRCLAVGGDDGGVRLDLFLEPGHADFEEFVEVARDDAEEAQAFEQRHAFVFGLGQNAPVEGEQTEFAVEVVFGREAGFRQRMGHRAISMFFLKYRL